MSTTNSWYYKNIEYCKEYQKEYRKNNRHIFSANLAKRRSRLLNRIPKWFTSEMQIDIQNLYKLAHKKTKETGIKHVVDHIVPLKGENISGLHVPWNMTVITNRYNCYKKNDKEYCQETADKFFKEEFKSKGNLPSFYQSIRVYCFETDKFYGSMSIASKELKVPVSYISQICNNKYGRKSINGYTFCYANSLERFEGIENLKPKIKRNTKSIRCINTTTKEIFNSLTSVCNKYNIKLTSVKNKIENKKPINGYIFEYL